MSVLGCYRNEISAVNLVSSYCLLSLLYGCEIWDLSSSDYHRMNVIWNNAFRKIFQCCWRESVACLLYYCKVLPLPYIIDQRKILFWKKITCSENSIIRSISVLNTCIGKTHLSKYSLQSLYLNSTQIKYHMWKHFVDTSVF